jgi:hypothetical protein
MLFNIILLNLAIIIIIVLLFISKFNHIKEYYNEELSYQGWELYTIEKCTHCKTQLDDIPNYNHYIMFSEKGDIIPNPQKLKNAKNTKNAKNKLSITDIYAFPLWYNIYTKKKIYGVCDIKFIINYNSKEQEKKEQEKRK